MGWPWIFFRFKTFFSDSPCKSVLIYPLFWAILTTSDSPLPTNLPRRIALVDKNYFWNGKRAWLVLFPYKRSAAPWLLEKPPPAQAQHKLEPLAHKRVARCKWWWWNKQAQVVANNKCCAVPTNCPRQCQKQKNQKHAWSENGNGAAAPNNPVAPVGASRPVVPKHHVVLQKRLLPTKRQPHKKRFFSFFISVLICL